MTYDSGLVARIADALEALGERGIRQKNVFSGWGFLIGKSTFAIAWREGMLVKAPRAEYDALLARDGVSAFRPGGDSAMGTWLVVSDDLIAEDPELAEWLRVGLRGIR